MKDTYIAHCKPGEEKDQSVSAHSREVSEIMKDIIPLSGLTKLAILIGLLHDAGKYSPAFQRYMDKIKKKVEKVYRGEVNHATAGGLLIKELTNSTGLIEILSVIVFAHHGLQDCIDLESGRHLLEKRQSSGYQEEEKIELELVRERLFQNVSRIDLEILAGEAAEEIKKAMINPILTFDKKYAGQDYGNRDFFMGMQVRLLLSVLIDSDRINTAEFTQERTIYDLQKVKSMAHIWNECIDSFQKYMSSEQKNKESNHSESKLDIYRREIAQLCARAAAQEGLLYRLTVPTGAGKTLSSLRFALHHAKQFGKQHIYYVASYTSILEQNAETIRKAVGGKDIVLEHHCNVLQETEEEKARYRELTENWLESPIIVTTAVQMLNTLFDGKTGSIRRMHSLCNSVIIFDEVQSLPIKTLELFNLAVNFLTKFCNTTVVLCSATQPLFDELPQNRLMKPIEMTGSADKYEKEFKRTQIVDKTDIKEAGLSVEELGEFVTELFHKEGQILIIVNTKSCAEKLYHYLEEKNLTEKLFHLSTNMHVLNRRQELEKMKKLLEEKEEVPLICVSTPLIEAGVDISFRSVIRSLTGLDSIIQAAGRCNRHATAKIGYVYVVRMNEKAENLSSLPDIKKAQEAMERVAYYQKQKGTKYPMDSEWLKAQYYRYYFSSQKGKTNYPVPEVSTNANLVSLLSDNRLARDRLVHFYGNKGPKNCLLKQAFKTAGELFEVIPEDGKFQVIVESGEYTTSRIAELEKGDCTFERRRDIIRELQLVTVGISQQTKDAIGHGIYSVYDYQLFMLQENYYDYKIGVLKEPKPMEALFS